MLKLTFFVKPEIREQKKQAGAELSQAQGKLKVTDEIKVEV